MKIEVKHNETKKQELTFPRIMQWKGMGSKSIVLFFSESTGVLLANHSVYSLGEYSDDCISCDDEGWELFDGEITLSN